MAKLGVAERMYGYDNWEDGDDVGQGALRALSTEVVSTPVWEDEDNTSRMPRKRVRARKVSYTV